MSLRDLEILPSYYSDKHDILNDFYIPVLCETVEYHRLTGFFSSYALAVAAKGIIGLLKNKGRMKMITSAYLREEDIKAIRQGLEKPEKMIEEYALKTLDDIEDELVKNYIAALGWLIAKKRLKILIAIVRGKNGQILGGKSVLESGIFHQKVGILKDREGNMISFSGSINETARAWIENVEEFKVFRNWENAEKEHFQSDYDKFIRYWNGASNRIELFEIPEAVRRKLIKKAPKNIDELTFEPKNKYSIPKRKLWKHQRKAVDAHKANYYKGILAMATGTGKTFTAIKTITNLMKEPGRVLKRVVVIVPQHELVTQWVNDLRNYFPSKDFVLQYDSKTSQNDKKFARKVWRREDDDIFKTTIFLVITVNSVNKFIPFKRFKPDYIIGDEVHAYGTKIRSKTLINTFGYLDNTLGLSATPERYFDPEGTQRILNIFGPIIFRYGIKKAQNDGILAKYYFYPKVVDLTFEEENQVYEISKKIAKAYAIDYSSEFSENEDHTDNRTKYLLILRAKIVKKAENKLIALRDILLQYGSNLKQCIVYCEDSKQLNEVQNVFNELGITSYVIFHSKVINRQQALNLFKERDCNYILSMHCLDQGVDIPLCESLILLSSSASPREYIQRRGRVLRKPVGVHKSSVKIFDIYSFPIHQTKIYHGLVYSQLVRAKDFIETSLSPEAILEFSKIMEDYKIRPKDIELFKED